MPHYEQEGVIKFALVFELDAPPQSPLIDALEHWRQRMRSLELIGGNLSERYDGLGFGNISHRTAPEAHSFLISGTQTGHLPVMDEKHYALVEQCDIEANRIHARGQCKPSSEAMTHHAIYQASPTTQAVIHVHSPAIWQQATRLGIAQTAADVPYGTPAMADALMQLAAAGVPDNAIVMAGHLDGVIVWGESLDQAGALLLALAARAGIRDKD
jgi:ribulose-5-phosphate 4-epimerase/fuculose-1-phosphate aldolase